ncbi:MAG: DNA polymerase III subunit delta [Candidatus Omnitrophica bacterium]|nr:DNA polymerase III subunit delta [Candidatus Omnitrophota bacterium]
MSHNYLITGNDPYIREREIKRIRGKYLSPGEEELNYSVYGCEDIDGIMDSLGTMPFLADKRVVLVKDAGDINESALETLLNYLSSPSDTGVLVIAGEFDKRKKAYKELSSAMEVLRADKPDAETVKGWIRKYFKREGIEISSDAVEIIAELKGDDTIGIKAELEKLAGFAEGGRIEASHVQQLVGRSVADTVFDLVDAINARKSEWVFGILKDLYDNKKQPQEILGYLGWYLRMMQKIALLSGRGVPSEGIVRELGYKPGYARRLLRQARDYPVKRIEKWTRAVYETDRDIKTGKRDAVLAMEMLMVEFLSG